MHVGIIHSHGAEFLPSDCSRWTFQKTVRQESGPVLAAGVQRMYGRSPACARDHFRHVREYWRVRLGREYVPVRVPAPGQHGMVWYGDVLFLQQVMANVCITSKFLDARQSGRAPKTCQRRIMFHQIPPSVTLLVPGVPGHFTNVRERDSRTNMGAK